MAQNPNQSTNKYLDQLVSDKSLNSTQLRTCLETIISVYRNIFNNSSDQTFCRIRTSNQSFRAKVWQHFKARNVLLNNGWTLEFDTKDGERQQVIQFKSQSKEEMTPFLNLLMDYKLNVRPDAHSFQSEDSDQISEQLKYEEMRRNGAQQRQQELEEFRRNQLERQTIAHNIKTEIESEVRYRQMKNPNKSPINP